MVAAAFANSPSDTGAVTGERSIRRRIWDTSIPPAPDSARSASDPVAEISGLRVAASAFLMGDHPAHAEPFEAWVARGATVDDWQAHLSTLFPDVRPRGYFEFRVADACAGGAIAALVALLAGIARHAASAAAALTELPAPSAALMARAGRDGLADPEMARAACTAVDLALAGCAALGPSLLADADVSARRPVLRRVHARRTYPRRRPAGGSRGVSADPPWSP